MSTLFAASGPRGLSLEGEIILDARSVSKSFGGLRAVDSCSFQARTGQITGLIGPNGAGKSTLLAILSGSMRPDSGTVYCGGQDITRWPEWRRARAGLIHTFQVSRPLGRLTVIENMLIGAMDFRGESILDGLVRPRRWRAAEKQNLERARDLLARFNLTRVADDWAYTLSGGQLRLLELARALMARPRLLLLDEPFAGVNPALAEELADHLVQLDHEGLTMILVEHELSFVARLCPAIVVMANGDVLAEGSMDELKQDEAVVDAYLGRTEQVVEEDTK